MMTLRHVFLGAAAGAMLGILACTGPEPGTSDPAPNVLPEPLPTDQWTYLQIDSAKAMWGDFDDPDWLRYFGLAAADFNADGYLDLVSGRTVYRNPGGDMTGNWQKTDLGQHVDANLAFIPSARPCRRCCGLLRTARGDFPKGKLLRRCPQRGTITARATKLLTSSPMKVGSK